MNFKICYVHQTQRYSLNIMPLKRLHILYTDNSAERRALFPQIMVRTVVECMLMGLVALDSCVFWGVGR
jgi:hypothetical protein